MFRTKSMIFWGRKSCKFGAELTCQWNLRLY